MRVASAVVGITGGVVGIAFAQMVMSVSVLMAMVASQTGEMDLGEEFYLGLVAILCSAFGIAGGTLALARPATAALLLLIASVGDLVTVFAISGVPETAGRPLAITVFPFAGPLLLFVACGLAALTVRPPRIAGERAAAVAAPETVTPSHARLATAVPMPLLESPVASAPARGELSPGTPLESYERHGEFVRVRGDGFEGYLPAWSVRRVA